MKCKHNLIPYAPVSYPNTLFCTKCSGLMDMITDVQLTILNGVITVNDMDYRTTAAFALEIEPEKVPDVDKLTYGQAVVVTHYANKKCRSSA